MFRYLLSRLLKLTGNIVKGVFFAVHFVAPGLRFAIPRRAGPLLKSGKHSPIPRTVWQTNYSRRVPLAVFANYWFNRMMAPTFEFRFLEDADIEEFIESCDAETKTNYRKLQIGAGKADFWRLLTVQKFGGAYIDIDGTFDWPLGLTLEDRREVFIAYNDGRLTNYFFASVPESPHLAALIERVNRNIAENVEKSIYSMTGPDVFHAILKDRPVTILDRTTVCNQGTFTNPFFQYLDRPTSRWGEEERRIGIVKS